MDKLPKDVVELITNKLITNKLITNKLITNKLTPREFFNYCKTETGQQFCLKKEIWLRRIQKDFGFMLEEKNGDKLLLNYQAEPKQAYLNLFIITSAASEEITGKILQHLGKDFLKFMKDDYEENLYEFFFNYLLTMLIEIDVDDKYDTSGGAVYDQLFASPEWQYFLPKLYVSELSDFMTEEIGKVMEKYATKIFS